MLREAGTVNVNREAGAEAERATHVRVVEFGRRPAHDGPNVCNSRRRRRRCLPRRRRCCRCRRRRCRRLPRHRRPPPLLSRPPTTQAHTLSMRTAHAVQALSSSIAAGPGRPAQGTPWRAERAAAPSAGVREMRGPRAGAHEGPNTCTHNPAHDCTEATQDRHRMRAQNAERDPHRDGTETMSPDREPAPGP